MRILMNLLGNAVKYTPCGGRISLTARRTDAQNTEFVIEDNGMGMKPEFMARMFEPFARAPEVDGGEIEGCGLGLSIVRRLTAELGGHIRVSSEWEKGTAFTLRLPLRAEEKAEHSLQGKCFLLAEDNEITAEIVQEILTAFESAGYKSKDTIFCEFSFNGSEAGTNAAYHAIDTALGAVRETYESLYCSETDISTGED
jgi:anti-sigma regulatory factor (Ser/Thr protein kinase)